MANGEGSRLTLTVEEAGEMLGISRASAFKFARDGTLPTIRVGRRLLVSKARLLRLLEGAGAPEPRA